MKILSWIGWTLQFGFESGLGGKPKPSPVDLQPITHSWNFWSIEGGLNLSTIFLDLKLDVGVGCEVGSLTTKHLDKRVSSPFEGCYKLNLLIWGNEEWRSEPLGNDDLSKLNPLIFNSICTSHSYSYYSYSILYLGLLCPFSLKIFLLV